MLSSVTSLTGRSVCNFTINHSDSLKFLCNFQTRDASVKNSLSMAQRPAPYHKLKNCVKFKLKPSSSQDLTKEKDENTYGTFGP